MDNIVYNRFSFIGLGLIGGSIAKALRRALPDAVIRACDPDTDCVRQALSEKVIDGGFTEPAAEMFDCDILFLCAPVSVNDSLIAALSDKLPPSAILTDVGSVKHTTYEIICQSPLADRFIGGHPMAGSEKTGYANASSSLLENAYYILTPSGSVDSAFVQAFEALIGSIGAIPVVMTPEKHDEVTAGISHLPHIIAAALVNFVRDTDDAEGTMKRIAAGGFKDITRIASSSSVMWQSICLSNSENIVRQLDEYIAALVSFKDRIARQDGDGIHELFARAKEYRDSFISADLGPIKKVSALYVDIPDVPGSIAQTATILALHSLSIKNIGIMHSREFQEGALRIEFYDDETAARAAELLAEHSYRIFR